MSASLSSHENRALSSTFPICMKSRSAFSLPGEQFPIVLRLFADHPRIPICEKSNPVHGAY